MRKLILIPAVAALLASCAPVEPAKSGRFQVVDTKEGIMRIDTQTGEAQLMVAVAGGPRKGFHATTMDGMQWVWADVVHGNGHD
jgi:hypothetical protein